MTKKDWLKKIKLPISATYDWGLLILVVVLTLFGLLMVYNASIVEAYQNFNNKYYYLKNQALWLVIGLTLMLLISKINISWLKKLSAALFFGNLILLALVLVPGISDPIKGAKRWLDFGFVNFQPAELIKLTFTMYLATWLDKKRSLLQFLLLITVVSVLIVLEPDLGTLVVIIGTALIVYFVSGVKLTTLIPLFLLIVILGIGLVFSSPYRKNRLLTYLDSSTDPLGSSYHIRQVLIALGSGGFFGLGLGQSRQKYNFLPEVTTDSIFAVIAEEVGFLGASLVILVFIVILIKGFLISKNCSNKFGRLLSVGITSWLGLQTIINLGAITALIPLTGLPLPFISYGGSSLITNLAGIGILLNIDKHKHQNK